MEKYMKYKKYFSTCKPEMNAASSFLKIFGRKIIYV